MNHSEFEKMVHELRYMVEKSQKSLLIPADTKLSMKAAATLMLEIVNELRCRAKEMQTFEVMLSRLDERTTQLEKKVCWLDNQSGKK